MTTTPRRIGAFVALSTPVILTLSVFTTPANAHMTRQDCAGIHSHFPARVVFDKAWVDYPRGVLKHRVRRQVFISPVIGYVTVRTTIETCGKADTR